MTVLELSRWQFGITTVYHFIFVRVAHDRPANTGRVLTLDRGCLTQAPALMAVAS
ncbi:MAG TPA: hypothetical protein VFV73_22880 [Streptosporangiaceae bacterium]|nr:hypothetical protein [Streptosporangiaceae bacterium]